MGSVPGATRGGIPFGRGSLFYLLRNRFYVGEVKYKDEILPGEQPAIMDRPLFDAVQQKLTEQWSTLSTARNANAHLLTGLLFDDCGHRMVPTHATKAGVRYRYYVSLPHLHGESKTALVGSVSRVPERRIRLNTLCVGTQAHEENLTMLERLAQTHDIRPLRWILVHSPFIESEQVKRYSALNFDVTTTMTYLFGMGDLFRKRFKPELRDALMKDLLPLRRYLDAGMTVTGGADWGPKSVFEHIQLSLTHITPSGYCNLGAAQAITRTEAVSMWTRNAARLLQWDDIGSLKPGYHADLIVVDRDPLTCTVDELGGTRVLRTMFAGRTVYDAGAL